MYVSFGEDLALDFSFKAEQGRHDVCALDVDHESGLSLYVEIVFDKPKVGVFVHPRFLTHLSHPAEPISDLSLNLTIEQSAEQRDLGARTHLCPLAERDVKRDDILYHGAGFELVKRAG